MDKCQKCIIGFEEGSYYDISNILLYESNSYNYDKKFTLVFKFCPICGIEIKHV